MRYFSTRDKREKKKYFPLGEASFRGLAPDSGLFVPESIPSVNMEMVKELCRSSYTELALYLAGLLFDEVEPTKLEQAIKKAYGFAPAMKSLSNNLHTLELFHGPTYAFKDFGARFMGQMLSLLAEEKETVVLTATSGDTGSAVANGFYGVEGVKVVVLYPAEKVSPLQEAQMTTLHGNIYPLKIRGTFDDCQRMVKSMFADEELRKQVDITSANSINILRWLPQSFYYFYGVCKWNELTGEEAPEVIVPSGNYGNLTAGMFARRMGLPIKRFIAASNANNIIPQFLKSGNYQPRPSVQTVANAMDVGAPSNYERMMLLVEDNLEHLRNEVTGFSATDEEIIAAIKEMEEDYSYLSCPHSAVGYLAAKKQKVNGFWLSTAHHAKFAEITARATQKSIALPENLKNILTKEKQYVKIYANETMLREYLLSLKNDKML